MLTEKDFCDYETCVALKELGYNEKCVAYYDTGDNVGLLYNTQYTCDVIPCQYNDLLETRNTATEYEVDAPTLYDTQKWLREEKKIEVVVLSKGMVGPPYYAQVYTEDYVVEVEGEYTLYEDALNEGNKEAIKLLKEERKEDEAH